MRPPFRVVVRGAARQLIGPAGGRRPLREPQGRLGGPLTALLLEAMGAGHPPVLRPLGLAAVLAPVLSRQAVGRPLDGRGSVGEAASEVPKGRVVVATSAIAAAGAVSGLPDRRAATGTTPQSPVGRASRGEEEGAPLRATPRATAACSLAVRRLTTEYLVAQLAAEVGNEAVKVGVWLGPEVGPVAPHPAGAPRRVKATSAVCPAEENFSLWMLTYRLTIFRRSKAAKGFFPLFYAFALTA